MLGEQEIDRDMAVTLVRRFWENTAEFLGGKWLELQDVTYETGTSAWIVTFRGCADDHAEPAGFRIAVAGNAAQILECSRVS